MASFNIVLGKTRDPRGIHHGGLFGAGPRNFSVNVDLYCGFVPLFNKLVGNMGSIAGSVLMKLGGLASDDPDGISVYSITLFAVLLCICILIGHLFEEYRWINESVIALITCS